MSVLNKVQAVDSGQRAKGYDPVRVRRKKLAEALQDQLNLINATENGENYRRVRVQRKRDLETDELFDVERPRRVAPWWWVDDEGKVTFSMRYGSVRLRVKDGKDALVFPSIDHLRKTLPPLRQEVLAGGLDEPLAVAAGDLQTRFKARKTG